MSKKFGLGIKENTIIKKLKKQITEIKEPEAFTEDGSEGDSYFPSEDCDEIPY